MAAKIFGTRPEDETGSDPAAEAREAVKKLKETASKVKYVKPKVLAIDLPDGDFQVIQDGGYNARRGTFGGRYRAPNRLAYVPSLAVLPNAEEQEIVIVDLTHREPDQLPELPEPPSGQRIWQEVNAGILEPGPRAMKGFQPDFDRILEHGGIFIVFADQETHPEYWWGEADSFNASVSVNRRVEVSNWSFLSALEQFVIKEANGFEVHVSSQRLIAITEALERNVRYSCVVEPPSWMKDRWMEFARTKYGDPIAGALAPPDDAPDAGWIFVFPQVRDKGKLVRAMLDDFLPRISPELFPQDDRQAWVENDTYALPGVIELQEQIREAEQAAEATIADIRAEIAKRQEERGYLHRILTAQSDELVQAVKETLELLGFAEVIDVDQDEGAEGGRLREDLRIKNEPETVLIEVKGITNTPRDHDSLQVGKYIPVRIKQWKDPEVRGLSIINHQKGLPPLQRADEDVFHDDIETNAQTLDFGLLTTWDLYRLARNYERLGWTHEDIRDVLLKTNGRIEPVPTHYQLIGTIENYFVEPEVITIQLEEGKTLAVGDRVAFQLPIDFIEEKVESMQIDNEAIEKAEGELVAVKTSLGKDRAKSKTRVFRVNRSSPAQ